MRTRSRQSSESASSMPFPSSTLEEGLRDGLHQAGHIEGTTIVIEWRRSTGPEEELRLLAVNLADAKVDVIVAVGSPATRAALQVTTLPVVLISGDPVRAGFAASLARPGGNGTGVSVLSPELEPKRLELLHQLVPRARRIGYLANLSNPLASVVVAEVQTAARTLGLQLGLVQCPDHARAGHGPRCDSTKSAGRPCRFPRGLLLDSQRQNRSDQCARRESLRSFLTAISMQMAR